MITYYEVAEGPLVEGSYTKMLVHKIISSALNVVLDDAHDFGSRKFSSKAKAHMYLYDLYLHKASNARSFANWAEEQEKQHLEKTGDSS